MSDSAATIQTAMDLVLKNNPPVKIRGAVHNTQLKAVLDHSSDRVGDVTFDQTAIADEVLIYYDSASSTYKLRKIQWHTVANMTLYNALVFDTDYYAMDYIQITDNGYGQTEIKRYINGAIRTISKYTSVTQG